MEAILKAIIVQIAELDSADEIEPSSELANDLGLDSLKQIDLIVDIEDQLEVTLTETEMARVATFGDLLNVIRSLRA